MKHKNSSHVQGALLVFILLFSIYLLTYSGVPTSDDEHLFAVVSQNLAAVNEYRADQLSGNQRLLGKFGNIGPLHPFIGSLAVRAVWQAEKVGMVQVLYFLNPFYTSATASLLYIYARRKKYSTQTSLFAALAFGLTTIVWPYTQTFYREPLAMLLFFLAFFFFESLEDNWPSQLPKNMRWMLWVLCFLGAALTKVYIVLVLPLFIIRIDQHRSTLFNSGSKKGWLSGLAVLGLAAILWIAWSRSKLGAYSRLQLDFLLHSWQVLEKNLLIFFSFNSIKNIFAILFSPAKGFLIYSPILMFSFFPLFSKKQKPALFLPVGSFLLFLFAQAFIYREEWWNISWSTRFLLPAIPLLFAASQPALEQILDASSKLAKGFLFGVVGAGFLIQLGGILISDSVYLAYLYTQKAVSNAAETIWSFSLMPAFQHWRLVFSEGQINLAAVRSFRFFPILISILMVIILTIILNMAVKLTHLAAAPPNAENSSNITRHYLLGLYTLIVLPVLLLGIYRMEPSYFPTWGNLTSASQYLSSHTQPGDFIVVDGYQQPSWYHLMNYARLGTPWYSLPEDTINWQPALAQLLSKTTAHHRTWILVENLHMPALSGILEDELKISCPEAALQNSQLVSKYILLKCD